MSQKNFCLVAGIVFLLVALVHLWRIVGGWDITISGDVLPIWTSWVAFITTGLLSFLGLRGGLRP